MDIKTILGLSSAIVGAGVVVAQDPSFEYPGIQPTLTSSQESAPVPPEQEPIVSVRFSNASIDEVLDWLSNQGVTFVAAGVPKDAKISLNLNNTPLSEAVQVLGHALGGNFVKHGKAYSFQKGAGIYGAEAFKVQDLKSLPEGQFFSPQGETKIRFFDSQDPKSKKELEEFHKKMQKEFGPDSAFFKQFHMDKADIEKHRALAEEMRAKFGPDSAFMKDLQKKMKDGQAHGDMQFHFEQDAKKWEAFGKDMEKRFGEGSAFQKEMQKRFGEHSELQKEMEKKFGENSQFQKEMEKRFGKDSNFSGKMFKLQDGKVREMSQKEREQMMKELELRMKNLRDIPMPKMDSKMFTVPVPPTAPSAPRAFMAPLRGGDISEIAKSLTPAQRELNKKQGFLYLSDLNPEQRAKLGTQSWSGDWTITYTRDGETFTIKSNRK